MAKPGPCNLITDVDGISVGNAENTAARTGVTVVLPDNAAIAAADIRGGAPGTRETETLNGDGLVKRVNAVVLSGGSAFGLDAASGVAAWLKAQGRGFFVGDVTVPIVPAAILFDLLNGGDKEWGEDPPYRALGRAAAASASANFALGNTGAGLGATAGNLKGGLGSASLVLDSGYQVGGGGCGQFCRLGRDARHRYVLGLGGRTGRRVWRQRRARIFAGFVDVGGEITADGGRQHHHRRGRH